MAALGYEDLHARVEDVRVVVGGRATDAALGRELIVRRLHRRPQIMVRPV